MIDKPFAYHQPSPDGLDRITRLREGFSALQRLIEDVAPTSRQRSVAVTELETAAMWAIKAVVFNDPTSEVTSLAGHGHFVTGNHGLGPSLKQLEQRTAIPE